MNVNWKRGSEASMVLIHKNYPNMFQDLTLRHMFQALDGELEYTEDKNKIIVKKHHFWQLTLYIIDRIA